MSGRRWSGDPTISRPPTRHNANGVPGGAINSDEVEDEDNLPDVSDSPHPAPPQATRTPPYSQPMNSHPSALLDHLSMEVGPSSSPSRPVVPVQRSASPLPDQSHVHFSVPQNLMTACLQLLQAQAQQSKLKIDYLRRREEREEKESSMRQELERRRFEREQTDRENNKESGMRQRAQLAMELMGNPIVDTSVRQAAVDYLKKLLATD